MNRARHRGTQAVPGLFDARTGRLIGTTCERMEILAVRDARHVVVAFPSNSSETRYRVLGLVR